MTSFIAILGRQPAIGVAELESVFGAENIKPLKPGYVLVNDSRILDKANYLGGTIKIVKTLQEIPSTNWYEIEKSLSNFLQKTISNFEGSKLTIGLSAYGFNLSPAKINASALSLKKIIKRSGLSARIVPNKQAELNAAQILNNKLLTKSGCEFVAIRIGNKTFLAQTAFVQDIDAYSARDRNRPARDARVGMLPPKLAQIIINLAVGDKTHQTILDPFCGTGVVLQEASLMKNNVYGTDLEPRMIDYSRTNLTWLKVDQATFKLSTGDATNFKWEKPFSAIAGETYLGRPLSSLPDKLTLDKIISDCDVIHKKFLKNLATQTPKDFRLCIAVPAWKVKNGFLHLPTLDNLRVLGYNRISFVHADAKNLIYHRENQYVGRELVVLQRI